MKTRRHKRVIQAADETEISILDVIDAETVCAVCSAEFLDEDDLKLHIMQVHLHEPNGKTICRFCFSVFCSADEYAIHLILKHVSLLNFCSYCYRAFLTTKDEHEQKHRAVIANRSVTCSQCTRVFTNRKILQKHEFLDHRDNEGVMLNGIFSLLSSALNIPIRRFLSNVSKNKPLSCVTCKYTGYDLFEYVNHLKMSGCRSYSCDKCYKVFKMKSGMVRHLLTTRACENVFRNQDRCIKCNKYFDVIDLPKHVESCAAVKCPTCHVIYNSMHDLTEHRVKEHNVPVAISICKFCKREFIGTANLKRHIKRSHKDYYLYKYRCSHCGSIFMHPRKLFAHYFTNHKDIQPYTCRICKKTFRLRKRFTIHIKMTHKSVGYVEFDENLHVFFSNKKSEKPFKPTIEHLGISDDSDDSQASELDKPRKVKLANVQSSEKVDDRSSEIIDVDSSGKTDDRDTVINTQSIENINVQSRKNPDAKSVEDVTSQDKSGAEDGDSEEMSLLILRRDPKTKRSSKQLNVKRKRKARVLKRSPAKRLRKSIKPIEFSDDEPLSSVRESLLKQKYEDTKYLKSRLKLKNKRAKLTCKICNKYCYTVQNYHYHMSLHENTKLKRCVKCHEKFRSKDELKNHIDNEHSSSKLTDTLRSLLEKRKKTQPDDKETNATRPADFIKSLVEKRKKSFLMNTRTIAVNKFRKTIKKVEVKDECTATITPMSDHGLSVKNFIENFRPDAPDTVSISNSVTIKTIETPMDKQPLIKMKKFTEEEISRPGKLKLPIKFKNNVVDTKHQVKVALVQQMITKPKLLNLNIDERIPVMSPQPEYSEYCNTFADETDYTQYKNEATIPEVAHEVMLGDADDVPRTRQLAQEIIIPNIPEKYGGVRIGHLLPDAPFYKIVKVKKLLKGESDSEQDDLPADKNIQLPDGTQLVTVKNPFSHLIPNEHLEELVKANRNRYYTPKTKNIEKALAKALKEKPVVTKKAKTPGRKRGRKKKSVEEAIVV